MAQLPQTYHSRLNVIQMHTIQAASAPRTFSKGLKMHLTSQTRSSMRRQYKKMQSCSSYFGWSMMSHTQLASPALLPLRTLREAEKGAIFDGSARTCGETRRDIEAHAHTLAKTQGLN